MAQRNAQGDSHPKPEYSIYVYRYPDDVEAGQSDWEKKNVTRNKIRALSVAKKLHGSAAYKRVEVKRKSFETRYERMIDRTFKVYEAGKGVQASGSQAQPLVLVKVRRFLKKIF